MGPVCSQTGQALAPGDEFVASLSEGEQGALIRHDYSAAAWASGTRPAGLFAFWRGVVPEPSKSTTPLFNAESLLDLFEQLGEGEDPKRLALRHIISLILIRKRHLQVVSSRAGATMVRVRGGAPEEPPIEVRDPTLDAETLADVTDQLRSALGIEV